MPDAEHPYHAIGEKCVLRRTEEVLFRLKEPLWMFALARTGVRGVDCRNSLQGYFRELARAGAKSLPVVTEQSRANDAPDCQRRGLQEKNIRHLEAARI